MSGPSRSGATNSSSGSERPRSDVRLFVANLAPIVSEHDLMSFFKTKGHLNKLDLVFQRSGPQKGQHKGYAFVEFNTAQEAERARLSLDGKPLRGREVRISYATAEPNDANSGLTTKRQRRPLHHDEDPSKHTLLSLSKNLTRKDSTTAKIAAMEAKLAKLQQRSTATSDQSDGRTVLPQRPAHLPPKPSGR